MRGIRKIKVSENQSVSLTLDTLHLPPFRSWNFINEKYFSDFNGFFQRTKVNFIHPKYRNKHARFSLHFNSSIITYIKARKT
jgi:hypothetical protein